jgi:MtfA peptidase
MSLAESGLIDRALWQSKYLSSSQKQKLVQWCRVFIAEKNWEGCNGQPIHESVQWTIAAQAGLMVLAYPDWFYDKTQSILVYPTPYKATKNDRQSFLTQSSDPIQGEFYRAGETIYRGPLVVNWDDAHAASLDPNGGNSITVHECAHQLDMINGPFVDGLPPLPDTIDENSWKGSMKAEFERARQYVEQGYRVLINDYGLSSESEFFAVASEYFFQCPSELREFHPQVYRLLDQFYQIDPASWIP